MAPLAETYQHSDNVFKNWTRAISAVVAVALAISGGYVFNANMWESVIIGLLATPLAPIAKDLSSALATAVNALQSKISHA